MRLQVLALSIVLVCAVGCGETVGDVVPTSVGSTAAITPSPAGGDVTRPTAYTGNLEECTALDRSSLDGQRFESAKSRAQASGCDLRQSVIDGEPQILTDDLVPYRIDVETKNGIVVVVGDLPVSR